MYAQHMIHGFSDEARRAGLAFEVSDSVTSDAGGDLIEAAVAARFAEPDPPDGLLLGSTTAAMAAIAAIERSNRVLGHDFDVVGKEAVPMLRRFRQNILIIREDVGRAGEFLARALVAQIDKRDWTERQGLEVPVKVEMGQRAETEE